MMQRTVVLLTPGFLKDSMEDQGTLQLQDTGIAVDLSEVDEVVRGCHEEVKERSAWDSRVSVPLHKALEGVPRRLLTDMRLWHWFCAARFREFVWMRWHGEVPSDPRQILDESAAIVERFIGTNSLRGVSRNTFARLFWTAKSLFTEEDGYRLVEKAWENQDFLQAIFERKLGLYGPAAAACLMELENRSEDQRRHAVRVLNHVLTTRVVETLDVEDIRELIRETEVYWSAAE